MTEDEAKTKWCPHGQIAIAVGPSDGIEVADNRPDNIKHANCIGSDCMMWRWNNGAYPLPNDPPEIRNRYDGFCGLAGKP